MQIVIVQDEIEEAIRSHILSQVSIRPGMAIEIDLSATRGPEGFKATIVVRKAKADDKPEQIVQPGQMNGQMAEMPQTSSAAPAPLQASQTGQEGGSNVVSPPFSRMSAQALPDAPVTSQTGPAAQTATVTATIAKEVVGEVEAAGAEPVEAEKVERPAARSNSLFRGLNRPTNS